MRKRVEPGLRALLALLALLLLLATVLVLNTLRQGSRQVAVVVVAPMAALAPMAVDQPAVAERMALAVRAKTSNGLPDPTGTAAEFDKLHEPLLESYPLVHSMLPADPRADMVRSYYRLHEQSAQ